LGPTIVCLIAMSELTPQLLQQLNAIMAEIVALANARRQRQRDFHDAIAEKQFELYQLTGDERSLHALERARLQ
jgi:hypothetical protein